MASATAEHVQHFEICDGRIPIISVDQPDVENMVHPVPQVCHNLATPRSNGYVTILIGDKLMRAHKDPLCSRIPFFAALFRSNMKECSTERLLLSSTLCNFELSNIKSLLDYAYTGKITISVSNVQAMMTAACYLQMESVMDECALFMRRRLSTDNVLSLMFFFRSIAYNKENDQLFRFIQKNCVPLSFIPEFLELSVDDLCNLLQSDSLYVDSELQVFEIIIRWIGNDVDKKMHAARLLSCVRRARTINEFDIDKIRMSEWALNNPSAAFDASVDILENSLESESCNTKERVCYEAHRLIAFIVIFGEDDERELNIDLYDPLINKWIKCKPHKFPQHLNNIAIIYCFGGSDDAIPEQCEYYDAIANQWITMPNTRSSPRWQTSSGSIDGKFYVVGGYDRYEILSRMEIYDPAGQVWSSVAPMSKERAAVNSCVLDGKIYAFGGYNYDKTWDDGECYDTTTDSWSPIPPMSKARWAVAAAALNGHIYVVGGADDSRCLTLVERYDPVAKTWTTMQSMHVARQVCHPTLVVSCGKLFAIGGWSSVEFDDCMLTCMEIYHPETNLWEPREQLTPENGIDVSFIGTLPVPATFHSPIANLEGTQISGFRNFNLRTGLLKAIVECGFMHPSDVQQECLPPAIQGRDLICQAESSMGKTSTFVIGTLQQLEPIGGEVLVLVLCPTREMVNHTGKEHEKFSKFLPKITASVFVGGIEMEEDEIELSINRPNIVIGTPARILALAMCGALDLSKIKHLVLDECDMLIGDNDMRSNVNEIIKFTPQKKQVMIFTTTLPKQLRNMCKKLLRKDSLRFQFSSH